MAHSGPQASPPRLIGQAAPAIEVIYYHADHLGTPVVLTDPNGIVFVPSRHKYLPFGEEMQPLGAETHTRRFTGHERDRESGLDYMLARYYGPGMGRFLSIDPAFTPEKNLATPQRWNRFVYALNNPMKYLDPDGRDIELSSQGRDRAVRNMLIETLMRPTGRAALQKIDSDHNITATFEDVRINSKQQIQSAIQHGGSLTYGVTKLAGEQVNPQTGQTHRDVSVAMDTSAIQKAHPDSSGVTTTAHESFHVEGYRQGQTDAQIKAGDKPTPSTGPAAVFGNSVASEKTDISKREAKRLLQQILEN